MGDQLTLVCLIDTDEPTEDNVFPIDIATTSTVHNMKELIKEANMLSLATRHLKLWKLRVPPPLDHNLEREIRNLALEANADPMMPMRKLSELFQSRPTEQHLHVIVQTPNNVSSSARSLYSTTAESPRDVTVELIEKWTRTTRNQLPEPETLRSILDSPLSEDSKLPLAKRFFDKLISSEDLRNPCRIEDVQKLFRISETESSIELQTRIWAAAWDSPPPRDSTEMTFVPFWDDNIRKTIEIIIPGGRCLRDSSRNTSTGLQRPNFAFISRSVCLLRGEEKSPTNPKNPKLELVDKLRWTYGNTPYLLGYYATGPLVTLTTLSRPPRGSQTPSIMDIVTADLQLRRERILNLRRLINLCSVMNQLHAFIEHTGLPDFTPIQSLNANGEVVRTIEATSINIKKTFLDPNAAAHINFLSDIYALLKEKDVPNVDHLTHTYGDAVHGNYVCLEPKGVSDRPKTGDEVLCAVACILEALKVMHREPKPLFHRDIRWPNIIRQANNESEWMLIDFDDASKFPTKAATHLAPGFHSPSVFKDGHRSEVDIWAVGKLICDAAVFTRITPDMEAIGTRMQKETTMTAETALDLVRKLMLATSMDETA